MRSYYETSTAYFWTRRDDQLEAFLDRVFSKTAEAWADTPDAVFAAGPKDVKLVEPNNPVASGVLTGFMPAFLFAQSSYEPASGALTLLMATDRNANGLPDAETEQALPGAIAEGTWTSSVETITVPVYDSAEALLGQLEIKGATVTATPAVDGSVVGDLGVVTIAGRTPAEAFIEMVQSIAGIDRAGLERLIKDIFNLDPAEPLPEMLDVAFEICTKPKE